MPGLDVTSTRASAAPTLRWRTVASAVLVALVALVATAAPTLAWATTSFSSADEQLLFTLTNRDRASAGLPALVNDPYLDKKAEWRSKDMGDRSYFSHKIPPNDAMVFDDMSADHYCFDVAGENIGLSTFGDDVATTSIEKAFMGSPTHRANILGTWVRMGVGAYKAADGRKLYTVLFSIPCSAKPKAEPKTVVKTAAPRATAISSATPTATPGPSRAAMPVPAQTSAPIVTFELVAGDVAPPAGSVKNERPLHHD